MMYGDVAVGRTGHWLPVVDLDPQKGLLLSGMVMVTMMMVMTVTMRGMLMMLMMTVVMMVMVLMMMTMMVMMIMAGEVDLQKRLLQSEKTSDQVDLHWRLGSYKSSIL